MYMIIILIIIVVISMTAALCTFPVNVLIETTVRSVNNKTDATEQLLSQASVDWTPD